MLHPRRSHHAEVAIRFDTPLNEREAFNEIRHRLEGTGIQVWRMIRLPRPRDPRERKAQEE